MLNSYIIHLLIFSFVSLSGVYALACVPRYSNLPINSDFLAFYVLELQNRFLLVSLVKNEHFFKMYVFFQNISVSSWIHRCIAQKKVLSIVLLTVVIYRCRIPECGEEGKSHEFQPEWIFNAVPGTPSNLASCERYAPLNVVANGSLNYCPANLFDDTDTVSCNGFVYARDNSVVYDVSVKLSSRFCKF